MDQGLDRRGGSLEVALSRRQTFSLCEIIFRRWDRCEARVIASGKTEAIGAFLCLFALLLLSSPAQARSSAPKACAPPPNSTVVVNVKDKGAKGDGRADDAAAIQAAIDAVGGTGGTVIVPGGTHLVDATGDQRLKLKSDMTLKLADGATLKAIPTDKKKYAMLTIYDLSHVWVLGWTLEGERDQHRGKAGEWGMGIRIDDDAKHITISGLTAKKMWGDGFYIQGAEREIVLGHQRRQSPPRLVGHRGRRPVGLELRVQEYARDAAECRHRF
jgi:Pectate lyase superfamily protein